MICFYNVLLFYLKNLPYETKATPMVQPNSTFQGISVKRVCPLIEEH